MSRARHGLVALVAAVGLAGCATAEPEDASTAAPVTPAPTTATATAPTTEPTAEPAPPRPRPRRLLGVDVSHHQGEIAWARVAGDGIRFAYLKATEGSGFSDPRFADNWRAASAAGLRVGGYHYFTLCSEPLGQAEHFVDILDAVPAARRTLPPVVDLELIGNCDPPPDPATMRASVEAFVAEVERRTGTRVVVYTHPDFDARYDFVDDLDRRRWVRRPGDAPPPGDWWLWQRSDDASVDGVAGPVDLDVMRARPRR
ncbi:MAG: lysozyme [Nocardioides sp.]|nr:lysozyme [Nocardioides sp.]